MPATKPEPSVTVDSRPVDDPGDPAERRDARGPRASGLAKILVVDDHPENLLAIESVLRSPHYQVVKARSGADALRFLLHDDCALILMDVQMPQLDGIETARLIRANERTRSIPIVFVTARHDEGRYVARGYDAGAIDYLLKPIDPDLLRAKVAAFVELHEAKQEIVRQSALLAEQERRERQRAVAELELKSLRRERAAQERYRRLVEGITHAIVWTIDPTTLACTFVSPSAQAILGHPTERWITNPDTWQTIVPAQDRARLLHAIRSLSPEEGAAVRHGALHADGRTLRFETDVRLVPAERAGRFEVRGFSVDVTDARLAEEALEFLDRSGAALAESLDLGSTAETASRAGVPFLADAAVVRVDAPAPGLPAVLAVAHQHRERVDALRALAAEAPLPTPRQDGRAEVVEDLRALVPPGLAARVRELFGEGPIRVVSVELGGRGRRLGLMHLVSGRRSPAPRELRLAEELGRRAAQALDHALLYHEAKQAVSARDEFISIASHELRTPLTPLHLQVSALQRGISELPDGPRRATLLTRLATFTRQVERMTRLVGNLLDVTRIHAGRLELEREPLELGDLVGDVAGRFRDELARSGRLLEARVEPALTGSWDRLKLDQVLTNLVSNAVRYGGQGPVCVELRREGGEAVVAVEDRGIGIAPEELDAVFERFRAGASSRAHGGLGLGLYITRRIVEAHGGTIAVESRLGEGTVFTVRLPLQPPG
jgi:PAS domain S-box-containing protein